MKIAVVGAGIAGLSCAYALKKGGAEVVVFEKHPTVGGRMASREQDGFLFDIGADHLCNHYRHMKALCKELGVEWEQVRSLEYGILKQGSIMPTGKAIGWWSKMKLFLQSFSLPKGLKFLDLNTAAAYDVDNAYDYMSSKVSEEAAQYYVDAFTAAYQFHRGDEISLAAFYAIMLSIKEEFKDWYLQRTKNGMSALPEALAEQLDVRLGTPVESVSGTADSNKKIVQYEGGEMECDAVVMACQAPFALEILSNPTIEQKAALEAVRYASSISVAFRVDADLMPSTTVVWVPYVESRKVASFVNEKMKGEQYHHDGEALVCVWLHEEYAKSIMDLSDDELFVEVGNTFVDVCPWFEDTSQLVPHDLQRWPMAMPKFYHGSIQLMKDFQDQGQGEDGIWLCSDYLNAPWTEGALQLGQRVAEQILEIQS